MVRDQLSEWQSQGYQNALIASNKRIRQLYDELMYSKSEREKELEQRVEIFRKTASQMAERLSEIEKKLREAGLERFLEKGG